MSNNKSQSTGHDTKTNKGLPPSSTGTPMPKVKPPQPSEKKS